MREFMNGKAFKNGHEDISEDRYVGQHKFFIAPETIEKLPAFLNIKMKSSLQFMKCELRTSKELSCRTVPDHLRYQKLCAHFVRHKIADDQKLLGIQQCEDIVERLKSTKKLPLQLSYC